jgi:hypothetical protein
MSSHHERSDGGEHRHRGGHGLTVWPGGKRTRSVGTLGKQSSAKNLFVSIWTFSGPRWTERLSNSEQASPMVQSLRSRSSRNSVFQTVRRASDHPHRHESLEPSSSPRSSHIRISGSASAKLTGAVSHHTPIESQPGDTLAPTVQPYTVDENSLTKRIA